MREFRIQNLTEMKNNLPLVSAIGTTKNKEKHLHNCLKSIKNPINPIKLCPGVNRETLRKDLNDLIVKKIILRKGKKVYIMNLHNCQLYAAFVKSFDYNGSGFKKN